MSHYCDFPISDAHVHLYEVDRVHDLVAKMDAIGYERFVLLSDASYFPERCGSGNLLALLVKLLRPNTAYSFAAFDQPDIGCSTAEELEEQADWMVRMNYDGVKMMEGKPNYRIRVNQPLDSDVFDKAYTRIEKAGLPVLMHVNDPRHFWEKEKCSPHAIRLGWYVPPGTVTFDQIRDEALRLAEKQRGIQFTFAHFFFASEGVDTAAKILDENPNVRFDLAPGMMVEDIAKDTAAWRDFFDAYAGRILFGMDHYETTEPSYTELLMRFWATEEEMEYRGKSIRGLGLKPATLEKVARTNVLDFAGAHPKKANTALLKEYANYTIAHTQRNAAHEKIAATIGKILTEAEKCM